MEEEKQYWVVIGTECQSCGGRSSVMLLDREPTASDEVLVRSDLGKMFCIRVKAVRVTIGESTITERSEW